MRIIGVMLVGVALFLAGCGSSDDEEGASATTATSTAEIATATTTPLDGTWQTEAITVDDMASTLREQGLGKWAAGFEENAPGFGVPTVLVLEIGDGSWNLYGEPEGGTREPIDYDAEVEVDGKTVIASHEGDSNTYRWSVDGDVLDLTWLETTYGGYKGIPEEVFQTALYETSAFQGS